MKLNKQLIEKVAKGDVAIDNTGNPNLELLRAVLKEAFLRDNSIPQGKSTYYQKHSKDYWVALEFTILPTILLSDFLEEEFVLPEKWCIEVTDENRDILNNYRINIKKYSITPITYKYMYKDGSGDSFTLFYAKEITFEQFKKYVLKQETMEKEIIGYELRKDCEIYLEALNKISGSFSSQKDRPYNVGSIGSIYYNGFKKAGVLELWFEPVYATSEQTVSMNGKFNLTVRNKRVFHKNEDITDYIEEIGTWWKNVMLEGNLKFAKSYDFLIPSHNIKIMKSGCQSQETYLSDWLKVYDLIK